MFFSDLQTNVLPLALNIVYYFSPIVLAFLLFEIFWPLWINYVQSDFIFNMKYTLLEIRLPKELTKSPLAMELVLNALHLPGDGDKIAQYWKGEKRPTFSLEIVSIEGTVKFFIRTEDRRKNGIISAMYSQFPGIEIHEAEDYTKGVHFDPEETKLWGGELELTKPDPYPIKTYIDYGLDKDPKEEFKIDPMTPLIEFLGSIGPNQQVWIQIIIRGHAKDSVKPGHLFKLTDSFKDEASKIINELLIRDPKSKVSGKKDKEKGTVEKPTLSEVEKEIVTAIERNMNKFAFDVGIRAIYLAKKENFDKGTGVGGINSSFKHFSSENYNGFKTNGKKLSPKVGGNPWDDFSGKKAIKQSKNALEAYKRRMYFYEPFVSKPFILTTEELATIYHFPGSVAATPSLNRIPSKKSEAPSNLPI